MSVLIVSPFLDPGAVGEPKWCHDLAQALSRRVDTTIIALSPVAGDKSVAELFPHARVYETPCWQRRILPRRMDQIIKPDYLKFYRFARRVLQDMPGKDRLTCAHQFGPLGMRYPTPLHDQKIPYVFGPLGGSLPFPPGFGDRPRGDPWFYRLRDIDGLRFKFDPLLRASYGNAACLVGVADYVREVLSPIPLRDFATHAEVTAPKAADELVIRERLGSPGPLKLLIVSRLIFSKGIHHALEGLARVRADMPEWSLDVLGEGPYRAQLQAMANDMGLTDNVRFHGHVTRAQVDGFYRSADMFLFPTIREPSGSVIFEAMSWGLPIIAADYGGPGTHIKDSFGIRIPVHDPQQFSSDFGNAILRLARDDEIRSEYARNALRVAKTDCSMDEMADFFLGLYKRIAA